MSIDIFPRRNRPGFLRIIWMGWRYCSPFFGGGEGRYYGWNLMLFVGPMIICIWPTRSQI